MYKIASSLRSSWYIPTRRGNDRLMVNLNEILIGTFFANNKNVLAAEITTINKRLKSEMSND